jgi:GINS complex subunit 1
MYGDLALRLIADAKRMQNLDGLTPYTDLVPAITREIRALDASSATILSKVDDPQNIQGYPQEACALLVHHLCMRRNKRCLLAYHKARTDRIDSLIWADGQIQSASPVEQEYARRYSELLASVKGDWTDIDLTATLDPPSELYVDVRVLKDAGEIQTEYG